MKSSLRESLKMAPPKNFSKRNSYLPPHNYNQLLQFRVYLNEPSVQYGLHFILQKMDILLEQTEELEPDTGQYNQHIHKHSHNTTL